MATDSTTTKRSVGRPRKQKEDPSVQQPILEIPASSEPITLNTTVTGPLATLAQNFAGSCAEHQTKLDAQRTQIDAKKAALMAEMKLQEAIAQFPQIQQIIAELSLEKAKNAVLKSELQLESIKRQSQSVEAQKLGYNNAIRNAYLLESKYGLGEVSNFVVSPEDALCFDFNSTAHLAHAVAQ
jgi:lipopolysaccharide export system protein LptC